MKFSVALWGVPFISNLQVFRIRGTTVDVSRPLRLEEMYRNFIRGCRDVKSSARHMVDSGPHASIIAGLPCVGRKLMNLEVFSITVIFTFFFVRCCLMSPPLVGLAQVDVVCYPSVPDILQSLFG
jgi:hypothetical protein